MRTATFTLTVARSMLIAMALAGAAAAGPLEDGQKAYWTGDFATALRLLLPFAEHGNSEAQLDVGSILTMGRAVRQNVAEGIKWLRKSAEQDNVDAEVLLGIADVAVDGPRDYVEAARWFRKAADRGNAEAMDDLAEMYSTGSGVTQDFSEALKLYSHAAAKGLSSAQSHLGRMYVIGSGVHQDFAEASKWYRLAADHGDVQGQEMIGLLYADGLGVPQDYVQAYVFLNLAVSRIPGTDKDKLDKAVAERDGLAAKMTSGQIAESQRLAREWKPAE
jgi:uncharacterized protein